MQRLNKFLAVLLVAVSFQVAEPVQATAPPPAFNICTLSPETCAFGPTNSGIPDFRMKVNGALIRLPSTIVRLGTADVNNQARVQVGYFDNNLIFDASTVCTASRVLSSSLITVSGQNAVTPWDTPLLNNAPISFGASGSQQLPVIFSSIPKGRTSSMRLRISCIHNAVTYMKQVTLTVVGQPLPGSFTFKATRLPKIPYYSTVDHGHSAIGWTLSGDVGVCRIRVPALGNSPGSWFGSRSYTNSMWMNNRYIQEHRLTGNMIESAPRDLLFLYPGDPGTSYTYRFEMSCSKVAGGTPKTITLTAERGRDESAGSGAGKTYDFSDGSSRFE